MGLQKQWYRVFYIMLCLTGAAMYIAIFAMTKSDNIKLDFTLSCFLLAPLMFFVGTTVYNVMKFYKRTDTLANWMLLGFSALVTILFAVGAHAIYKADGLSEQVEVINRWYSIALVSVAYIGQLIVFGLMPLIKGISKTLFATAAEDNNVPLPPLPKKEKPAKAEKAQPAQTAPRPVQPTKVAVQPPVAEPKAVTPVPNKAAPIPRTPKPKQ